MNPLPNYGPVTLNKVGKATPGDAEEGIDKCLVSPGSEWTGEKRKGSNWVDLFNL